MMKKRIQMAVIFGMALLAVSSCLVDNTMTESGDDYQERITSLEERMASTEEEVNGILDRIQSVSVIPDLSDGSVRISGAEATFDVRMAIYPLSAAQSIAEQSVPVSFEVVKTDTKSSSVFTKLEISQVRYENELLIATVSSSGIPSEITGGEKRWFGRVSFYSDSYQKSSDFFPLTYVAQ